MSKTLISKTGVQFEGPMGGGIGTGVQFEGPMGGGIGTDH